MDRLDFGTDARFLREMSDVGHSVWSLCVSNPAFGLYVEDMSMEELLDVFDVLRLPV
jgi:hypothetical protein